MCSDDTEICCGFTDGTLAAFNILSGRGFSKEIMILGEPEVTANIYCKSDNLPNTDTQNYITDLW